MNDANLLSLSDTIAARHQALVVARDLFPLCDVCGRDLSTERLTRLVYLPARNRFRCSEPCPPVAA